MSDNELSVCVVGLWHLGSVTAAGISKHFHTVGVDPDTTVIAGLAKAEAPIFEPGLNELLRAGLDGGRLRFSSDAAEPVQHANVVWVTFDTPVNDDDVADVAAVERQVAALFPHLRDDTVVLVSSQLPVGTTKRLATRYAEAHPGRQVAFAYSPENLRLGKALDVFLRPERIVVGVDEDWARERLAALLRPLCDNVLWMKVTSAEVTKHALNAFLATSVTFINEIAAVCENMGADAKEVERGLKSDVRIGPRAYLGPGAAFAGGTLARDIGFLVQIGERFGLPSHLFRAVKASNDAHRGWARRLLDMHLGTLSGRRVSVLGLTYKPGTDTLRRSSAVELCHWLKEKGATVAAFDPVVKKLPPELGYVEVAGTAADALRGAEAAVIGTEWPELKNLTAAVVKESMKKPLVLDPNRFLGDKLDGVASLSYVTVGKA